MTPAAAPRTLWPHQREAVDAVNTVFETRDRATVIAACGSGKTTVGGEVAYSPGRAEGPLLIVAPTLELIGQILAEYGARFGVAALGRVVAVCSDHSTLYQAEVDLRAFGAQATTSAARLAQLMSAGGRKTVVCTYQSLKVLREAHAEYRLARWGLAIVDEAHHTAGPFGRPWSVIHDNQAIPCAHRLYLSATPRVLGDPEGDEPGASMDDEAVFGPIAYQLTFADAIRRGLLADYACLVPVITDEQVGRAIHAAQAPYLAAAGTRYAVSPRMLAVQIAVLRAAAEHGLRRIITYHRRIASGEAFAATLHAAAGLLEPAQRPQRLTALSMSGQQSPTQRRATLASFASNEPGLMVISNARVLGEGVDVPAVDAVAFIDPIASPEFTMQAVGRALRTGGRTGKVAKVIIPVLEGPDQQAVDTKAWDPLWATVRALRAHDERLAASLDELRRSLGARGGGPRDLLALPSWLSLSGVEVPPGFADAVAVRVVKTSSASWEEQYGRAEAFHGAHGHLRVKRADDLALYQWLDAQRTDRKRGRLSAERIRRLDLLAMIWSAHDEAWWAHLEAAAAYRAVHGHLSPTATEKWGDPPWKIGSWVAVQRRLHRQGQLPADRVAALERLGIVWDLDGWDELIAAARGYHATHGHLNVPDDASWGEPAYPLGASLTKRRGLRRRGQLPAYQVAALDALGIPWDPRDQQWSDRLDALVAHRARHAVLPSSSNRRCGTPPFDGYGWLSEQRRLERIGELHPQRARRLDEVLGADWRTSAQPSAPPPPGRVPAQRSDPDASAAVTAGAGHGRTPPTQSRSEDREAQRRHPDQPDGSQPDRISALTPGVDDE